MFEAMIAEQRATGQDAGDHYAKPGHNDRVWNALEKLAVADPEVFVEYYGNDIIALASASWLGPGYTVTSQVNVVNPGGAGQIAAPRLPPRLHDRRASPRSTRRTCTSCRRRSRCRVRSLTATCRSRAGRRCTCRTRRSTSSATSPGGGPEFKEYFAEHHVQLPLTKGDAVFFNPALFHAAGTNHSTDIHRMANLLQINSPLGKTLESIDHERMSNAVFPALLKMKAAGASAQEVENSITAAADGYAFPVNLDRDQPIGGLTPDCQADVLRRAVDRAVGCRASFGPSCAATPTAGCRSAICRREEAVVASPTRPGRQGVDPALRGDDAGGVRRAVARCQSERSVICAMPMS